MALESPQTFSDWYWNDSVLAQQARAESIEKTLAPVLASLIDNLPGPDLLPPYLKTFFDTVKAPQHPDFDNILVRFLAEFGAGAVNRIVGHEFRELDYGLNSYLQNVRITPDIANNLMLRKKITPEFWAARQKAGGFSELEGGFALEAMKPYPALPEIITYGRYHSDPISPKDFVWGLYDINPDDWELWNWLSLQKCNTEQVQSIFKRGIWKDEDCRLELQRLGWQGKDVDAVLELSYSLPNPMLLVQGQLMKEASTETLWDSISLADIHPVYAPAYLDGILTKPATADIIQYSLRVDPTLSQLDRELRKIGIHPDYFPLYKELAYPIPPIQDIIQMAVREAFSPDVASRFGQYEDLPQAYVDWVQKKGLSKEWAERYWAAHWSLPSPQQGFEMLHRGIINADDLQLLLRALDIMPFWRDKLIQMSYQPLTRIDVRRMYQTGVLDEGEVTTAYRAIGYDPKNAQKLTDFTVKLVKQSLSRFTSNDVIRAYVKHYISADEAYSMLIGIGIKDSEAGYIINTATYKKQWADKDEQLDAIANLYKKGSYSETQARSELAKLNLPTDYVNTIIEQWQVKAKASVTATWTNTQTLSFFKKGLISKDRAVQEFRAMGYDDEHINIYVSSVQSA